MAVHKLTHGAAIGTEADRCDNSRRQIFYHRGVIIRVVITTNAAYIRSPGSLQNLPRVSGLGRIGSIESAEPFGRMRLETGWHT
jgi:hypothetical protein